MNAFVCFYIVICIDCITGSSFCLVALFRVSCNFKNLYAMLMMVSVALCVKHLLISYGAELSGLFVCLFLNLRPESAMKIELSDSLDNSFLINRFG